MHAMPYRLQRGMIVTFYGTRISAEDDGRMIVGADVGIEMQSQGNSAVADFRLSLTIREKHRVYQQERGQMGSLHRKSMSSSESTSIFGLPT